LKNETSFTALLVYVKDIVLIENDLSIISYITNILDASFKIKDLGDLRYLFGFEVACGTYGINICKKKML